MRRDVTFFTGYISMVCDENVRKIGGYKPSFYERILNNMRDERGVDWSSELPHED